MSAVISWRQQGDIDVLHLGEIPVGRVKGKAWIFNLKYPACFWKGERSEALARSAVTAALSDWLTKAGLTGGEQMELFHPTPEPTDER